MVFNRQQQKAFRCFTGKDFRLIIPIFSRDKRYQKRRGGKETVCEDGTSRKDIKTEGVR